MFIKQEKINDISYLEKHINQDTLLVSSWNIDGVYANYEKVIAEIQASLQVTDYIHYRYPDELFDLKNTIKQLLNNCIEVSIFPSATVGSFLLSYVLKKLGLKNVLLIAPCYYSYLNIYLENGYTVFSEQFLNMKQIKKECKNKNIDIVIFTDPLFCESISITDTDFLEWCEMEKIVVIIDSVYGNLTWDNNFISPFNNHKKYISFSNLIIIESISKKAYLNGVKSAIFLTQRKELLKEMERTFNYSASPFSIGSLNMLKSYLDNGEIIDEIVETHLQTAKSNFQMISAYLQGTCIQIEPCNQGYWGIAHIDMKNKNSFVNPSAFALDILQNCNIFTIPMDSYFKNYEHSYSFRVNLLNDVSVLHLAFSKLIDYYE
ncbi:aminotransferase class I/II-fold pyridoxal phosphate-dependent enzyme [Streptococcus ruminantium]|uniref:aminotransferase class I/II-fold pyridoxal phosphate-dependent enzyme n=1 Tax=Streptococcus ruminantium TaxID=1917441 RepID=UPI0013EEEF1F|nr:aminotransferase class I/II-fold pyridoxal phosphate-dependent enzyme [Streptococcus ruminantium]BDD40662.1 hypothetical protein GUT184_09260 [Streptococcus ruminantium]